MENPEFLKRCNRSLVSAAQLAGGAIAAIVTLIVCGLARMDLGLIPRRPAAEFLFNAFMYLLVPATLISKAFGVHYAGRDNFWGSLAILVFVNTSVGVIAGTLVGWTVSRFRRTGKKP